MGIDDYNKAKKAAEKAYRAYMLHGHVHLSYGRISRRREHEAGTMIVNACGYQIIEIEERDD